MEIFWICLTTFIVSGLTLFSGFGLGTILMPVVAIFLPVPIAIAITAVVHFMNKIFKLLLLWRHVDMRVLVVFGIPALLAAIPGALLLDYISELNPLATYMLLGNEHSIAPVKLVAGLLLIFFAVAEQVPFLRNNTLRRFGLPVGGLLSGFFGGLTGQQGAFRSAFLVQDNLSEKAFIATNAAIAALVDAVRLVVYGTTFNFILFEVHTPLVLSAIVSSFFGVFLGAMFLEKITIRFIQQLVAVMMYAFGILLCVGLI
jgi:uncharacterized membrane protein YfcA